MRVTVRVSSRKVNHLSKVFRERKITTLSISSTRIGEKRQAKTKVPKANTTDWLIERTSSMLDEIESEAMHNNKEGG